MLIIAGAIHLLPLPGVLGVSQLGRLYGIALGDPNLVILMRHRAVLFGLLGILLVTAAFRIDLRPVAFVAGIVSAASFLAIAATVGNCNGSTGRVVIADIVALACLLVAVAIDRATNRL